MIRMEQESDKRSGRLVGAAETSKELGEWRRLQQRNLSKLGLLKKKEWPRCHRESSWQVRQSRQFKAPDDEGGESRWARATPWGERGRSEREHEEERVDYTVKEGRFQGEEEEQARKAFLGEVEGSMSG